MPLTPSIGLSVIVHIVVILLYQIMTRLKYGETNFAHLAVTRNIIGYSITLVVSFMIFTGAFQILHLSVTDEHSSIRLISEYVGKALATSSPTGELAAGGAVNRLPVADLKVAPPEVAGIDNSANLTVNCAELYREMAARYDWSVTKYLEARGHAGNYEARVDAAALFGIVDYRGTAGQNRALMMKYFEHYGELPPPGSPICGPSNGEL